MLNAYDHLFFIYSAKLTEITEPKTLNVPSSLVNSPNKATSDNFETITGSPQNSSPQKVATVDSDMPVSVAASASSTRTISVAAKYVEPTKDDFDQVPAKAGMNKLGQVLNNAYMQ